MDLEEFKAAHPIKPKPAPVETVAGDERMVYMGPARRPHSYTSNLDAGFCPICMAMVKEVGPSSKIDFRIVFYVCVENKHHRFSRPELERKEPSAIQKEAWAAL